MTAFGTIGSAVDAVKKGAENYLTKPLDFEALAAVVERAMEKARLLQENLRLRERLRERNVIRPHRRRLAEDARAARARRAGRPEPGERAHHRRERHRQGAHRRGHPPREPAREGAVRAAQLRRARRVAPRERALRPRARARSPARSRGARAASSRPTAARSSSTRSSEIPPATQVKLLRFLQERAFERVGGNETLQGRRAHHRRDQPRSAGSASTRGAFREDLYYRLNVVRSRSRRCASAPSDIAALATFFLRRYAQENGKRIDGFDDDALARCSSRYAWPGNVRELENAIERAVVLCDEPQIERAAPAASIAPASTSASGRRRSRARRIETSSATRS